MGVVLKQNNNFDGKIPKYKIQIFTKEGQTKTGLGLKMIKSSAILYDLSWDNFHIKMC